MEGIRSVLPWAALLFPIVAFPKSALDARIRTPVMIAVAVALGLARKSGSFLVTCLGSLACSMRSWLRRFGACAHGPRVSGDQGFC